MVAPTRATRVQKWCATGYSARLIASRGQKDSGGCRQCKSAILSLLVRPSCDGQFDLVGLGRRMSPLVEHYGKPVQLGNVDANLSVAARTNGVARRMRRALSGRFRRAGHRPISDYAFKSRTSDEGV